MPISAGQDYDDLVVFLRLLICRRAASQAAPLLRKLSRIEDPRKGALYLGAWLRPLPPESIVVVLQSLLEGVESREPGSDLAVQAIFCPELLSSWPEGLARQVQVIARLEGRFDLAAMLLEMPAMDVRFAPGEGKLPKELKDIPLGVRKAMARCTDIYAMEHLLADTDETVIANLLDNPRLTVQEVIRLAAKTDGREEVLEMIAMHPRWISQYRIKVTLAHNPSTPMRISLGILRLLMVQDLEELSRDGRLSKVIARRAGEILRARKERARASPDYS